MMRGGIPIPPPRPTVRVRLQVDFRSGEAFDFVTAFTVTLETMIDEGVHPSIDKETMDTFTTVAKSIEGTSVRKPADA